jgi:hypothetical protein
LSSSDPKFFFGFRSKVFFCRVRVQNNLDPQLLDGMRVLFNYHLVVL